MAHDQMTRVHPVQLNTSGTVGVNQNVYWLPINHLTPCGVKLQLINRKNGVAVYGVYYHGDDWTHWQGLPKFADGKEY